MTGSMVNRATSDMLIGPDWALNVEICDVLNHDPGLSKDVARGIKKRIRSRNPKVQLLALTLLETMIRNCGDIVHMHLAEKDIPHQMVKIVKKKRDFHVKEKILELIDTWQEALGGSQARHPQVYAAYQDLLRAGAVFPQKHNRSAPIFTPQTRPGLQKRDSQQGDPGNSSDSDSPAMSLSEIQTARGIMDVLSEMLNIINPGDQEGLKQEVVVDLVKQCRSFRRRVVHLVNTTADEDLLCHGLALNDDLQRVLAKHETIANGTAAAMEKPNSLQALVDIDDPTVPSADGNSSTNTSNQPPLQQLLLPAPPTSNGEASANVDPFIDFLSGEDLNAPASEDQLGIVAVTEPLPNSASESNALALSDMFSHNTSIDNNSSLQMTCSDQTVFLAQQSDLAAPHHQLQESQLVLYSNGVGAAPQYAQNSQVDHANSAWNGSVDEGWNPQHHEIYTTGINEGGSLPPPPWETQPMPISELGGSESELVHGDQPGSGVYPQGMSGSAVESMHPGLLQGSHELGMFAPAAHSSQQTGIYSQPMQGSILACYTYGQQPEPHSYDQRPAYLYAVPGSISQGMYGLSMRDNSRCLSTLESSQMASSSAYIHQPAKPCQPEDRFFGDLVTMAKSKQNKSSVNSGGL